jgi:hypothetical protein
VTDPEEDEKTAEKDAETLALEKDLDLGAQTVETDGDYL